MQPDAARQGAAMSAADAALLDVIATPIVITHLATTDILFANAAAKALFERPADLPAGHRTDHLYADANLRGELIQRLRRDGSIQNFEIEFQSFTGRRFWGLLSGRATKYEGADALVASIVDISAQKEREVQLAQATEQLRVQAASTAQLNHELKRQRQVAITASRAKSDFLARMSHELRSPLNAILGFSEVIAGRVFGADGTARYEDYARNINQAGTHLLELINDILDLSKVEAGEMQLSLEPIELKELINSSVQLMTPIAEKRGVQLVVDLGRSPLSLVADRRRLRQMVVNLVSNAIKFTLAGGTVMITAHQAQGNIVIDVADSGIGMTPDQVKVALQPFGQVPTDSPYAQTGTGLGLPIVDSLVKLHGGKLDIQSTPNVGTTVTLTIPKVR
ncbi:sensor histidine kinase [Dongia rigui]|uniref:histidine kinase n=1 Tax=Dongia rigui TaxID=940149 RepID=A0ABU5DYR9_9PROT|nr:HAMP domain-containing sensor histidine kinase [Dongia rigui]MDY0872424.1 HAMP domain-containing sensor histidine kinase [Dongia rigui]